jgi:hypothetical protein
MHHIASVFPSQSPVLLDSFFNCFKLKELLDVLFGIWSAFFIHHMDSIFLSTLPEPVRLAILGTTMILGAALLRKLFFRTQRALEVSSRTESLTK